MGSDAQSQRQQARYRISEMLFRKLHDAAARGESFDSLAGVRAELKKFLWDLWLNEGW